LHTPRRKRAFNFKEACLLIRCLVMDAVLTRALAPARMCLPSVASNGPIRHNTNHEHFQQCFSSFLPNLFICKLCLICSIPLMNADLLQDKAINCKFLFQPKRPQFILPQHLDKLLKLLSNYIKILGRGFPLLSFYILPAKTIVICVYSFVGDLGTDVRGILKK
jgi:hypothetical protein